MSHKIGTWNRQNSERGSGDVDLRPTSVPYVLEKSWVRANFMHQPDWTTRCLDSAWPAAAPDRCVVDKEAKSNIPLREVFYIFPTWCHRTTLIHALNAGLNVLKMFCSKDYETFGKELLAGISYKAWWSLRLIGVARGITALKMKLYHHPLQSRLPSPALPSSLFKTTSIKDTEATTWPLCGCGCANGLILSQSSLHTGFHLILH